MRSLGADRPAWQQTPPGRSARCSSVPSGPGRRRGALAFDADRSGQLGRPVAGCRLRLDGALVGVRGLGPRSRRSHRRSRLSRRLPEQRRSVGVPTEIGPGRGSPRGPAFPTPAIAGLRFSLEPAMAAPRCRCARRWSGRVGGDGVVATLTFASGLATLDSHPALYGWNWNYAINSPAVAAFPRVGNLWSHDPDVAAWTGNRFGNVQIDGLTVPILLTQSHAALGRPSSPATRCRGTIRWSSARRPWPHFTRRSATPLSSATGAEGCAGLRPPDPASDRRHGHDARDRRQRSSPQRRWEPGRWSPTGLLPPAFQRAHRPARSQPRWPGHGRRAAQGWCDALLQAERHAADRRGGQQGDGGRSKRFRRQVTRALRSNGQPRS